MTTIAPVLFKAFPEDAPHSATSPYRECINTGASAEAIETISTPYEPSGTILVAIAVAVTGLAPLAVSVALFFGNVLHLRARDNIFDLPAWLETADLAAFVLFWSGCAWTCYLASSHNPKAKAWKKTLGAAWATYGGDIIDLRPLNHQTRKIVLDSAAALEKVRGSLNWLGADGDELDVARYRLQRYIDASSLPALGAKAAKSTHLKDPMVRKAAREYEEMVKQQRLALQALDTAVIEAKDLLATRRQARSDADLIKQLHQL